MIAWNRFVAIGDSFTEGLWDFGDNPEPETPTSIDGSDDERPLSGWADRLASELSRRRIEAGQKPLEYANLAIRGKKLRGILGEQLPAALDLKPDLISLGGGANDMLRVTVDVDQILHNLESTVIGLRERGIDVLLQTGMDAADSPIVGLTRARVAVFNSTVWSISRRHGCYVLDLWGMRSLRDWRMWAEDRIHLTPEGHRRVAQAALVGLGLAPSTPDWDNPLTPIPKLARRAELAANVQWARDHLAPWVGRHLRGRSSGDNRVAKQPQALPLVEHMTSREGANFT